MSTVSLPTREMSSNLDGQPVRMLLIEQSGRRFALPVQAMRGLQPVAKVRFGPSIEAPPNWMATPSGSPVGHLSDLLQLPEGGEHDKLIVFDSEPRPFCIAVERARDQFSAPRGALFPALAIGAEERPVAGVLRLDNEWLPILAPHALAPEGFEVRYRLPEPRFPDTTSRRPLTSTFTRTEGTPQILLFPAPTVANRPFEVSFGLALSQVLEIAALGTVVPVPRSHPGFLGLVEWRSLPIPVLDLSLFLGLTSERSDLPTRMVVARNVRGDALVGFAITSESAVVSADIPHQPWERQLPFPQQYALGVYDVDGDLLLIPDCDVLTAQR